MAVAELEKAASRQVQYSPGILSRRVPDGVCHPGDISRTWPSLARRNPRRPAPEGWSEVALHFNYEAKKSHRNVEGAHVLVIRIEW